MAFCTGHSIVTRCCKVVKIAPKRHKMLLEFLPKDFIFQFYLLRPINGSFLPFWNGDHVTKFEDASTWRRFYLSHAVEQQKNSFIKKILTFKCCYFSFCIYLSLSSGWKRFNSTITLDWKLTQSIISKFVFTNSARSDDGLFTIEN